MTPTRCFQILFVALVLLVTVLSLLPIDHPTAAPNDKLNHLLAWGALGVTAGLGWRGRWWVFAALLGYSMVIEAVQGMSGFRMFSWADGLANAAGLGAAMLVLWMWYNFRKHRSPESGNTHEDSK